ATVPAARTAQRYRTTSGVEVACEVFHAGVDERRGHTRIRAEPTGELERDGQVRARRWPRPEPLLGCGTARHGERSGRRHRLHLVEVVGIEERRPEAGSSTFDQVGAR